MDLLQKLADDLARDALDLATRTGDDGIVDAVSKAVGESSPTVQEAYLTAVRFRRAEARGRRILEEHKAKSGA